MINFQELEKVAEFKNGELNWLEGRDINAVYVILVGDEYYIGSSHYTYLRIGQHLSSLLEGMHHSDNLQKQFDKIKEFEVYVLERGIGKASLKKVENRYIQKYRPSLNMTLKDSAEGKCKTKFRIVEMIQLRGMTISEFIEQVGWKQRSSLYNMMSGNPTMQQLEKIASVLGCKVSELLSEGFTSTEEDLSNVIICPKCGAKFELKEE